VKTSVASVHVFRRAARKKERQLQAWLDRNPSSKDKFDSAVPDWAQGVRVEKAGFFQWAVVYTSERGH